MNADFDPEQPDAANDPLLAALRRQLGENFGQAPPPQAWAGIRQRLAPRPWWRRPRNLLPALTLLLSLCMVVGLLVARRAAAPTTAARRPSAPAVPVAATHQAAGSPYAATTAAHLHHPVKHSSLNQPVTPSDAAPSAPQATRRPADVAAAGQLTGRAPAGQPAALASVGNSPATGTSRAGMLATASGQVSVGAVASTSRHQPAALVAAPPTAAEGTSTGRRAVAGDVAIAAGARRTVGRAAGTTRQHWQQVAAAGRLPRHPAGVAALAGGSPPDEAGRHYPAPGRPLAANPAAAASAGGQPARPTELAELTNPADAAAETTLLAARPTGAALLAVHPVPLLLPAATRPATLTPLPPDSSRPHPSFRRWSVQLLAGPTLSYRTVPSQITNSYSTSIIPSTGSLVTGRPAYYDYERPALGWGTQVQARRILTGRWALAVGLGYHEYATRLDLQIRRPNDSTLLAVHQRDTYRMLTVPLQVSYRLGPPRPHLGLAVLAGAEPGWYRGGRVSEGSDCACQQQAFAQAADSPYNAWSVALSLGLDLRYRLGGPASRWQLLVQPTGRYVATPFVRNGVSSHVRRQPYSLGLLTGLAWDWH